MSDTDARHYWRSRSAELSEACVTEALVEAVSCAVSQVTPTTSARLQTACARSDTTAAMLKQDLLRRAHESPSRATVLPHKLLRELAEREASSAK